jgi:hypothetical protein
MPRPQRSFVALGIAIIALAPFLPGISAVYCAVIELQWVLMPDEVLVCVFTIPPSDDEQPLALAALLPARAPPSSPQG